MQVMAASLDHLPHPLLSDELLHPKECERKERIKDHVIYHSPHQFPINIHTHTNTLMFLFIYLSTVVSVHLSIYSNI